MPEPLAQHAILTAAAAGAAILLFGAAYAALFALARLLHRPALMIGAWTAYGALAIAGLVLARALAMQGAWTAVVAAMLAGYCFAPPLIWRLCQGTHAEEDTST